MQKNIADSILACMRKWGLDITKLRGQGYDGASVISGHVQGVQTRKRERCPNVKIRPLSIIQSTNYWHLFIKTTTPEKFLRSFDFFVINTKLFVL